MERSFRNTAWLKGWAVSVAAKRCKRLTVARGAERFQSPFLSFAPEVSDDQLQLINPLGASAYDAIEFTGPPTREADEDNRRSDVELHQLDEDDYGYDPVLAGEEEL
jgi:hypothetical protein